MRIFIPLHPSLPLALCQGRGLVSAPGTLSPSSVGHGGGQTGQRGGLELFEQTFLCQRSSGHPSPDPSHLSAGRESALVLPHKVSDGFLPQSVSGAALEGHCLVLNWPLVCLQWLLTFQLQSNSFQADACRSVGCQIQDLALHMQNCLCNLFFFYRPQLSHKVGVMLGKPESEGMGLGCP